MTRAPVTPATIVGAARTLLVRGGLESVVVREVARSLGVSAPALYKHVDGRTDIVDRLSAVCLDELTDEVVRARDAAGDEPRAAFVAAGLAWYRWAHRHPAEFALLFATPAVPFERPTDGRGRQAGLRLGRAFLEIVVRAADGGRLLAPPDHEVPPEVAVQLRDWGADRGMPLGDGQLWTAVSGFHDLLGLVMVEAFGQLGFALADTDAYMRRRLARLADALIGDPP
jgi:AcrR family transcriptional regulator